MTDAEVLRQINRRLDKQDEQLSAIREEQVRAATAAETLAPAVEEIVAFWK